MPKFVAFESARVLTSLRSIGLLAGVALLACGGSSGGNGGGPGDGGGAGSAVRADDSGSSTPSDDSGTTASDDGGTTPTPGVDGASPGDDAAPETEAGAGTGGLHTIMGNGVVGQIVDGNGKAVRLRGVNIEGPQYMCSLGYSIFDTISPPTQASLDAMKSWGINAIRIPMNEDCWLNINGVKPEYGGTKYQSAILGFVNLVTKTNGMYAILDLHYAAAGSTLPTVQGLMPDADHSSAFWSQVAAAYKDNGSVIFDLFNEPNTGGDGAADYSCWRDGDVACNINHYASSSLGDGSLQQIATCNNNNCSGTASFKVVGMQSLLNTVRTAGAKNLVLLDGIGDAWNLGLWPSHVPTDMLSPPNIAAGWHFYDNNAGCNDTCQGPSFYLQYTDGDKGGSSGAGVGAVEMAGYPIIVGETGIYANNGPGWWDGFLTWLDGQGISYMAWAWATTGTPAMLADTTKFTPLAPNGTIFQAHLSKLGLAH